MLTDKFLVVVISALILTCLSLGAPVAQGSPSGEPSANSVYMNELMSENGFDNAPSCGYPPSQGGCSLPEHHLHSSFPPTSSHFSTGSQVGVVPRQFTPGAPAHEIRPISSPPDSSMFWGPNVWELNPRSPPLPPTVSPWTDLFMASPGADVRQLNPAPIEALIAPGSPHLLRNKEGTIMAWLPNDSDKLPHIPAHLDQPPPATKTRLSASSNRLPPLAAMRSQNISPNQRVSYDFADLEVPSEDPAWIQEWMPIAAKKSDHLAATCTSPTSPPGCKSVFIGLDMLPSKPPPPKGVFSINPPTLWLRYLPMGVPLVRRISVTNASPENLAFHSLTVSQDEVIVGLPYSVIIAPGATADVPIVVFGTKPGPFDAVATLISSAGHYSYRLKGVLEEGPFGVGPSLSARVSPRYEVTRNITLVNTFADTPLTVHRIWTSGPPYILESPVGFRKDSLDFSFTIPPGGSSHLATLHFHAAATGPYAGFVRIDTSAGPLVVGCDVVVMNEGVFLPDNLDFGAISSLGEQSSQPIRLLNSLQVPVSVTGMADPQGDDLGVFSIQGPNYRMGLSSTVLPGTDAAISTAVFKTSVLKTFNSRDTPMKLLSAKVPVQIQTPHGTQTPWTTLRAALIFGSIGASETETFFRSAPVTNPAYERSIELTNKFSVPVEVVSMTLTNSETEGCTLNPTLVSSALMAGTSVGSVPAAISASISAYGPPLWTLLEVPGDGRSVAPGQSLGHVRVNYQPGGAACSATAVLNIKLHAWLPVDCAEELSLHPDTKVDNCTATRREALSSAILLHAAHGDLVVRPTPLPASIMSSQLSPELMANNPGPTLDLGILTPNEERSRMVNISNPNPEPIGLLGLVTDHPALSVNVDSLWNARGYVLVPPGSKTYVTTGPDGSTPLDTPFATLRQGETLLARIRVDARHHNSIPLLTGSLTVYTDSPASNDPLTLSIVGQVVDGTLSVSPTHLLFNQGYPGGTAVLSVSALSTFPEPLRLKSPITTAPNLVAKLATPALDPNIEQKLADVTISVLAADEGSNYMAPPLSDVQGAIASLRARWATFGSNAIAAFQKEPHPWTPRRDGTKVLPPFLTPSQLAYRLAGDRLLGIAVDRGMLSASGSIVFPTDSILAYNLPWTVKAGLPALVHPYPAVLLPPAQVKTSASTPIVLTNPDRKYAMEAEILPIILVSAGPPSLTPDGALSDAGALPAQELRSKLYDELMSRVVFADGVPAQSANASPDGTWSIKLTERGRQVIPPGSSLKFGYANMKLKTPGPAPGGWLAVRNNVTVISFVPLIGQAGEAQLSLDSALGPNSALDLQPGPLIEACKMLDESNEPFDALAALRPYIYRTVDIVIRNTGSIPVIIENIAVWDCSRNNPDSCAIATTFFIVSEEVSTLSPEIADLRTTVPIVSPENTTVLYPSQTITVTVAWEPTLRVKVDETIFELVAKDMPRKTWKLKGVVSPEVIEACRPIEHLLPLKRPIYPPLKFNPYFLASLPIVAILTVYCMEHWDSSPKPSSKSKKKAGKNSPTAATGSVTPTATAASSGSSSATSPSSVTSGSTTSGNAGKATPRGGNKGKLRKGGSGTNVKANAGGRGNGNGNGNGNSGKANKPSVTVPRNRSSSDPGKAIIAGKKKGNSGAGASGSSSNKTPSSVPPSPAAASKEATAIPDPPEPLASAVTTTSNNNGASSLSPATVGSTSAAVAHADTSSDDSKSSDDLPPEAPMSDSKPKETPGPSSVEEKNAASRLVGSGRGGAKEPVGKKGKKQTSGKSKENSGNKSNKSNAQASSNAKHLASRGSSDADESPRDAEDGTTTHPPAAVDDDDDDDDETELDLSILLRKTGSPQGVRKQRNDGNKSARVQQKAGRNSNRDISSNAAVSVAPSRGTSASAVAAAGTTSTNSGSSSTGRPSPSPRSTTSAPSSAQQATTAPSVRVAPHMAVARGPGASAPYSGRGRGAPQATNSRGRPPMPGSTALAAGRGARAPLSAVTQSSPRATATAAATDPSRSWAHVAKPIGEGRPRGGSDASSRSSTSGSPQVSSTAPPPPPLQTQTSTSSFSGQSTGPPVSAARAPGSQVYQHPNRRDPPVMMSRSQLSGSTGNLQAGYGFEPSSGYRQHSFFNMSSKQVIGVSNSPVTSPSRLFNEQGMPEGGPPSLGGSNSPMAPSGSSMGALFNSGFGLPSFLNPARPSPPARPSVLNSGDLATDADGGWGPPSASTLAPGGSNVWGPITGNESSAPGAPGAPFGGSMGSSSPPDMAPWGRPQSPPETDGVDPALSTPQEVDNIVAAAFMATSPEERARTLALAQRAVAGQAAAEAIARIAESGGTQEEQAIAAAAAAAAAASEMAAALANYGGQS